MNTIAELGASSAQEEERPRFWLSRLFSSRNTSTEPESASTKTSSALNMSALQGTDVSDIAIPMADIVALSLDADLDMFLEALREHSFSRIPVYRENLDDPIGLIHIKDIFMTYGLDLKKQKFSLEPFVRPLIYVPPSMALATLLQRMQNEHVHMALVIDEYGGVDGLITIEDILEEIVGDITDEHDELDGVQWRLEKPGVYDVDARAQIEDFQNDTQIALPDPEDDEDIDTIGGLVMTFAGRVPVKDEVIRTDDGFEFEILDADLRRIKRVRLRPPLSNKEGVA